MAGYHKSEITKGILGYPSKIQEELEELQDAVLQEDKILTICEMSDLYGALEAMALNYGLTMDDLKKFSDKTKLAFKEGKR